MSNLDYRYSDLYWDCGIVAPDYVVADVFCMGASGSTSTAVTMERPSRPARPYHQTAALLREPREAVPPIRARVVAEIHQAQRDREAAARQAQIDAYLAKIEDERRMALAEQAIAAYAPQQRKQKIMIQTANGSRLVTIEDAVRDFYRNRPS